MTGGEGCSSGGDCEAVARDLALLRSSELTIEQGYKYFSVLREDYEFIPDPYPASPQDSRGEWHNYHYTIKMSVERPDTPIVGYDARIGQRQLRQRYGLKPLQEPQSEKRAEVER